MSKDNPGRRDGSLVDPGERSADQPAEQSAGPTEPDTSERRYTPQELSGYTESRLDQAPPPRHPRATPDP